MTKKEKIKREKWLTGYRITARNHFQGKSGFSASILNDVSSTMKSVGLRRRWYLVTYSDTTFEKMTLWVLYDHTVKALITVLPENEPPNIGATHLIDELSNEFSRSFEDEGMLSN